MNDAQAAAALLGMSGSVGDPAIAPYYPGRVGDVAVQPRYVGLPIQYDQGPAPATPVQLSQQSYVSAEVTWFGLGSTAIAASSVGQNVSVKPLRPFTPQRQYHPSTIQDLLVIAASIGGTNIYSNMAGVPVELFSEVSTAPQISWPTVDTSVGIDFSVANLQAVIQPFRGALYGTAARR
jgi:hypothetical protein